MHHRFFTNEKLFKMCIKKSNMCGFCYSERDSVEHVFLNCEMSEDLGSMVGRWIGELGMENYHLSSGRIIIGDL